MLRQIIYDMRRQSLIAIVSLVGTALSVFLIIIVMMMADFPVRDFGPEPYRSRSLYYPFMHLKMTNIDRDASSAMSMDAIRELFTDLDGAEAVAAYQSVKPQGVSAPNGEPMLAGVRYVAGADYWKVFPLKLVHGRYFTDDEAGADPPRAVISQGLARELHGTDDVVGQLVMNSRTPAQIVGVVEDVTAIAQRAKADLWQLAYVSPSANSGIDRYLGGWSAIVLAPSAEEMGPLRDEIRRRYSAFNDRLAADSMACIDHQQPYTIEQVDTVIGSNMDPDASDSHLRWIIYGILLLIPAINLSSMTQSRLRRRVSEIGIRRAFGATRWAIARDLLAENFVITLIGGILGLIGALIMGRFLAETIFLSFDGSTLSAASIPASMLISWQNIAWAVAACFVLNLLSAGLPAWLAARVNPAEAISGLRK